MGKETMNRRTQMRVAPTVRRTPVGLLLALGGLLVLLLGVVLATRPPAQQAAQPAQGVEGPRLAVDQEKIDFGQVPVERMVAATFELRNTGDRPLQILSEPQVTVKEGC